ncbi:MAG: nickel-dependent lactate racemase [Promethearchaeia archaeon]
MKKLNFDYGKKGLEIELDPQWHYEILRPKTQERLKNPEKTIRHAIQNPLESRTLENIIHDGRKKKKAQKICIVVSDATRPVPSKVILKGVISELLEYGINYEQILILIATGLHRPTREEELNRIIGKELLKKVKVMDHIATDTSTLINLGTTSDNSPIQINKFYYESDVRIITGYVEPHFFAGFSGGRKSIVPGIAGKETILANHSAKNIDSPHARFGHYEKNPIHQNAAEIAREVGVDFTINVCINEKHQITYVQCGDWEKVHKSLVEYQSQHVFKELMQPYDIVVCGNGGYPLDLNLYQAIKSMAIGEMAAKENGTIISVNQLSDGIGVGQNNFKDLLFSGLQPKEIYRKIMDGEITLPDQWEIQILARILMKSQVYVVSQLTKDDIGNIGLKYAPTAEEAIKESLHRHGKEARILFLPHGPLILPSLRI